VYEKLSEQIGQVNDFCGIADRNTAGLTENSLRIRGYENWYLDLMMDPDGVETLLDIIVKDKIEDEFYINSADLEKWRYLKGAKNHTKVNAQGFEYKYSEGSMSFPDAIDKPSRTIITGEGGKAPSRFKHVIDTEKGYRRLTPIELERLNMFPDNHTQLAGVSDTKRAFFMGNALVVGVIEKIGVSLKEKIENAITLQSKE